MTRPHRAYELDIHIGGDSWEDVLRHLQDLAHHIPDHGLECNSTSGGYSANHTVHVAHRPEMNHDRYFDDLSEYLKALPPA